MQPITLHKLPHNTYQPNQAKSYAVTRNGEPVGYVTQDVALDRWHVQDNHGFNLATHSTIKTATRRANTLLITPALPPLPASWVLIPCDTCDGEGFIEAEEPGGHFSVVAGQWYPKHTLATCPTCNGNAVVEVETTHDDPDFEFGYLEAA